MGGRRKRTRPAGSGLVHRVHLKNSYFDNMNVMAAKGYKFSPEDEKNLDLFNQQTKALHQHLGTKELNSRLRVLIDEVSRKIGCTNPDEPRSVSILAAKQGQALHLDCQYYNIAAIGFLDNNEGTTLVECAGDIMQFCWEHAKTISFRVERFTVIVFRGHFPHAAPVVPSNWPKRWVVYLGYFTSDIDAWEESLYFENDVRSLNPGNWKMGVPVCCRRPAEAAPTSPRRGGESS